MTNEQAITALNMIEGHVELAINAKELAKRALRKHIPRKKKKKDGYFVCSICRKLVVYDDAYCRNCGKAIDWSEYE